MHCDSAWFYLCGNGQEKDIRFACLLSSGLRSVNFEWRKLLLQIALDLDFSG